MVMDLLNYHGAYDGSDLADEGRSRYDGLRLERNGAFPAGTFETAKTPGELDGDDGVEARRDEADAYKIFPQPSLVACHIEDREIFESSHHAVFIELGGDQLEVRSLETTIQVPRGDVPRVSLVDTQKRGGPR